MIGITSTPAKAAACAALFPGCFSAIVTASADKSREQLGAELSIACNGEGIHMYFDNTGGVATHAVFPLLNEFGRGASLRACRLVSQNQYLSCRVA